MSEPPRPPAPARGQTRTGDPPAPPPEQAARGLWEAGRAAWPGVDLPAAALHRHLSRHLPEGEARAPFLGGAHGADLYLACACAAGLPAALAAFDVHFLSKVPALVARVDRAPAFADEVCQRLRDRLLVAEDGRAPRIASYNGGAALASWLRVVAVREAVELHREREGRGARADAAVAAALPPAQDPVLGYLWMRYAMEFQEAVRDAIAALAVEQRNVLRLHYAHGLTGERIAAALQVSRPTVVRWLASARQAVLRETRRLLQERLRIAPEELESLIRAIRSQLDLSLSTVFGTEPDPP